jgi:hypothetical protein
MEICEHCGVEVHGGFDVSSGERETDGAFVVRVERTPDCDYIVCDDCNAQWCFECCARPESGLCNDCLPEAPNMVALAT